MMLPSSNIPTLFIGAEPFVLSEIQFAVFMLKFVCGLVFKMSFKS